MTTNGAGDVYHPTCVFDPATASCSFTDVGNVVTLTAHGLVAGDILVFDSIATTTGVSADTAYYVLAVTDANDFTISATLGGAVLVLTTDGTGTVRGDQVGIVGHGYSAGQRVMFSGIVSSTGLVEAASYYVLNPSANSFGLSLLPDGSGGLVDIDTAGYGILYIPSVGAYVVQITVQGDDLAWSDASLVASTEYQYRGSVSRKTFEPDAGRATAYDQTTA